MVGERNLGQKPIKLPALAIEVGFKGNSIRVGKKQQTIVAIEASLPYVVLVRPNTRTAIGDREQCIRWINMGQRLNFAGRELRCFCLEHREHESELALGRRQSTSIRE